MGALTNWGAFNRRVTSGLVTTVDETVDAISWDTKTYIGLRNRKKTYEYVGMTYETAKLCQAEKELYYTRRFWNWYRHYGTWTRGSGSTRIPNYYNECVATFEIRPDGGGMYSLVIQVNEDTIAYTDYHMTRAGWLSFIDNMYGEFHYED